MQKLIPFKNNKLWGYINENSEVIIEPKFIKALPFNDEYAIVSIDTRFNSFNPKYGLINTSGDFVIEPHYVKIENVSNGIVKAETNLDSYCGNRFELLNLKGEKINHYQTFFSWIKLLSNGYWIVEFGISPVGKDWRNFFFNIIDKNGEIVENFNKFSTARIFSDFENGIIKLYYNNKTFFLNEQGDLLFEVLIDIKNISNNYNDLYFYLKDNMYGFIDVNNKFISDAVYEKLFEEDIDFSCSFFYITED